MNRGLRIDSNCFKFIPEQEKLISDLKSSVRKTKQNLATSVYAALWIVVSAIIDTAQKVNNYFSTT